MHTQQLQHALKAAQEAVRHLTEMIEGLERKINPDLLKISIKVANEDEYNAVRGVLDANGCLPQPVPRWSDWGKKEAHGNYHVICVGSGEYGIYTHSGCNGETRYTFTEFMTKYAK
jgi:predicted phage tail protein